MPPPIAAPLPRTFTNKKARILAELAIPDTEYLDKSPKGSVDAGIRDLIAEINSEEGLVTTSSCAGRVSVFVEGAKATTTGGKGGGKWLFVSHEPVREGGNCFMGLFGLSGSAAAVTGNSRRLPRFIRLSFEPLILHVLCASLAHAKPLLAAAISAGFRESGLQSLKSLDDLEACPMVAIRSAGMGFETVIGIVEEDSDGEAETEEVYQALVSEEYIGMMMQVVEGRFGENEFRRERFRKELRRAMAGEVGIRVEDVNGSSSAWEDSETRRVRKREEGLRKQQESRDMEEEYSNGDDDRMSEGIDGLLLS